MGSCPPSWSPLRVPLPFAQVAAGDRPPRLRGLQDRGRPGVLDSARHQGAHPGGDRLPGVGAAAVARRQGGRARPLVLAGRGA